MSLLDLERVKSVCSEAGSAAEEAERLGLTPVKWRAIRHGLMATGVVEPRSRNSNSGGFNPEMYKSGEVRVLVTAMTRDGLNSRLTLCRPLAMLGLEKGHRVRVKVDTKKRQIVLTAEDDDQ